MHKAGILILAMLGIFLLMSIASAETVTIPPTDDSYVNQRDPDENYNRHRYLEVKSKSNKNMRTFIKFDISSIPVETTIISAKLRLYMYNAPGSSRIYDIHRVTGYWTETGITWNNQPNVADSLTDSNSTGTTEKWLEWDVASDVQGFVNSSYANYGWRIKDRYEDSTISYQWSRFRSREYTEKKGHRPQLVITYMVRNVTSCDKGGEEKNIFELSENVYCHAAGLPPSTYVDIYVVNNKDEWHAGDTLTDVSGGAETVQTESDGSISATKIWSATLAQGSYDIIVDVNQNGEWDKDEPIDSKVDVGFEAIPEFPTLALPLAIVLGIVFFLFRGKREKK